VPVESFEHRLRDVKADLRRQQFGKVIHLERVSAQLIAQLIAQLFA
jgi:hypothetical protein